MNPLPTTRLLLLRDPRSVPSSPRARRYRLARLRLEGPPADSPRESAGRPQE